MTRQEYTDHLKSMLDCREVYLRFSNHPLRKSGQYLIGPCPWCGGHDRFFIGQPSFQCRTGDGHCGKTGDVFKLVQHLENVSYPEAVALLDPNGTTRPTDWSPARSPIGQVATKAFPPTIEQVEPGRLEQMQRELNTAQTRLKGADGVGGQGYLLGRGLLKSTWESFRLGFNPKAWIPGAKPTMLAPGIAVPWYYEGRLQAIRYRLLEECHYINTKGDADRIAKFATSGSKLRGLLYRHPTDEPRPIAIVTEGELNAMSLWQATRWASRQISCYSVGSNTTKLAQPEIDHLRQCEAVLFWADEVATGDRLEQEINGDLPDDQKIPTKIIKSPVIEGIKYDANEILRLGKLHAFMIAKLFAVIPTGSDLARSTYYALLDHLDNPQWMNDEILPATDEVREITQDAGKAHGID